MKTEDVAAAARAFLSNLPTLSEKLNVKEIECRPRLGPMNKIFRDDIKTGGGVYWFSLEDGEVFDVGKSDANVWARVCAHARAPVWLGESNAGDEKQTTGEGWSFPNSTHLNGGAGSDATREAILRGRFYVGWLTFEPGYASTLVEVYLQTLCRGVDGRLPEFCFRIG